MCFGCCNISPITPYLVLLLLFVLSASPVKSQSINRTTRNFRHTDHEAKKLNLIRAQLMKINKPAVKTIQSVDGDIINCVFTHKQPAFDHPLLQGQKPLDPPQWPKGYEPTTDIQEKKIQVWSMFNETCPEGTIPVRRTTEEDLLRESSLRRLRRKLKRPPASKFDFHQAHEYAKVFVDDGEYYGAKATMSVWTPHVANKYEFSASQLRISTGNYHNGDLNTIEVGWQAYVDNKSKLFISWTRNSYQSTGCYNLHCSGFVQISSEIVIGDAIAPTSSYNGPQQDIDVLVWKDPMSGNWWLAIGKGNVVGYWPLFLFTHLKERADMLEFGGEILNLRTNGSHTSTQMGSRHFAEEGYQKAAYIRNLTFHDKNNQLNIIRGLNVATVHSNCYDVQTMFSDIWETYFYYGGPGKSLVCP